MIGGLEAEEHQPCPLTPRITSWVPPPCGSISNASMSGYQSSGLHCGHKSGVIGGAHRVLYDVPRGIHLFGHQQPGFFLPPRLKLLRLQLPPLELQISCLLVSYPFRIEF